MRRVPPGPKPRRWAAPKRPPATQLPHDCVVLAVDTAQVSGWCLSLRGIYISSGQFDVLRHPEMLAQVCGAAVELGRANQGVPVVLVYEKPFAGTSQGQYIGTWKGAFRAAGGVLSRMTGVYPSSWRARVLGSHYASARRETVRPVEQRIAAQIAGRPCGGDESPAVCIGRWAAHAGEVLAKLPAGKRKAVA